MKRELKKIIKRNTDAIKNSGKSFEDIYNITFFNNANQIMAEFFDGYRIREYTYSEVEKLCQKSAASIYKTLGETHAFVGLSMENSVDWIAAFWGILKSGNKPYLINTRHTDTISNEILKKLGITKIICDKKGTLNAEYIEFSALEKGEECIAQFENEIAIATSATSLQSSICFYSGQNVSAQILNTEAILKENKRIALHYKGKLKNLAFLPFYHIFGLFAVYFWFTFYGRTIVFLKDIAPDTILNTCKKHNVTHIFAVPMLWHTVEKQVLKKAEEQGKLEKLKKGIKICTAIQNISPYFGATLSKKIMSSITDNLFGQSVKFCISGGSFLKDSALQLFNGIGYALHNGYGMSEIGIGSVELRDKPKHRNQGFIGKAFQNIEYQINEDGVLKVRGASLCSKKFEGENQFVVDGWFETGDIVEQTDDGYYRILGRKGDVVIGENGENINPDVIERHFPDADVINLSVLGLDDDNGEELVMVAQVNQFYSAGRISDLLSYLKARNALLTPTESIKRFYMTYNDIAPKTAIKVSRKYLLRGIKNGEIVLEDFKKGAETVSGSNNPLCTKVLSIIAPILETKPENIDCGAHLIQELGATSLQYFAIISALAEEFNLSSDSNQKFVYTVNELCEYIERHI